MTKVQAIFESNLDPRILTEACRILKQDGVLLIPTDTGYGLVASAHAKRTRERFVALRQAHPKQKPFSLLCRDVSQVATVANLPTSIYRVAKRVWPGPYTLILESNRNTPQTSFAQSSKHTVGIRISAHPVAAALTQCWEGILLITSITDADELALSYYDDPAQQDGWWTEVDSILERIPTGIDFALSQEDPLPLRVSSVLDCTVEPPALLRDGGWDDDV